MGLAQNNTGSYATRGSMRPSCVAMQGELMIWLQASLLQKCREHRRALAIDRLVSLQRKLINLLDTYSFQLNLILIGVRVGRP